MAVNIQEKKGIYYAVLRVTTEDGSVKQKWVSTKVPVRGHHKREAMAKAKEIAQKYEEAKIIDYPKMSFSDWIWQWLEQKKMDIDIITYQGYESYYKNHIKPYFSKKKLALQDVTPQDIQEYYNTKRKDPNKNNEFNKGRLSGKSLKSHHIVIRGSLEDAVRKNIIPYNPADRVTVPKAEKFVGSFYTEQQAKELLSAIKGDVLEEVIGLTLFYGMRKSEVLGLKWSAVDFVNHSIKIVSTRVRFSEVICKEKTKNQSSRRTYPMTSDIELMLKNVQERQKRNRKKYGEDYTDSEYIFTWPDGRPFTPDFVSRHFATLLRRNNLPPIRFHDLRHTTASMLIAREYHLKNIQEWLGHSDIGTTANIYGHLAYDSKKELANNLGKMIDLKKKDE